MAGRKRRFRRLISRKAEITIKIVLAAAAVTAGAVYGIDRVIQSGVLAGKPQVEGVEMTPVSSDPEVPVEPVSEPEPRLIQDPDRDPTASLSSPLIKTDAEGLESDRIETTDVSGNWRLILVNPTHKLPDDFWVDTCVIVDEETGYIDERIHSVAMEMLEACEAAGHKPIIRGAYRTRKQQRELYEEKVQQFLDQGESKEQAELDASTIIALPGTSEHELGLALDIVSMENDVLNEAQEDSAAQQWLMEHSWEYGFVLRYPTDKCEYTGIIYEPWHYRYVGREAAKVMYEEDLCLEEYLDRYGNGGEDT